MTTDNFQPPESVSGLQRMGTIAAIVGIALAGVGFALSGPASREIVARLLGRDLPNEAFPFMACAEVDCTGTRAVLARLSLTGELGYEINVPVSAQLALYELLVRAGHPLGLRNIGNRALDSLRLEKSYAIWSAEYTQAYTPGMCGLARHVAWDEGDFIGREAGLREREHPSARTLVTLDIDATDADALGFEPVRCNAGQSATSPRGRTATGSGAVSHSRTWTATSPPRHPR